MVVLMGHQATQEKLSEDQLENVWREFVETRSAELREVLILQYAWLVKYVLGRLSLVLPPSLDYEDLVGHGTVALVEAVDKYEPERGYKFSTYAAHKIKGAILDALRSMDFVSRPARKRMSQVAEVVTELRRELGRTATDEEVAQRMGLSVPELYRIYRRGSATVVSLDALPMFDSDSEDLALAEAFPDANVADPEEEAIKSELADTLASVLEELPERDQYILQLYYREGLTLREIGEVLGISESRVCQIHGKALAYLRAHLMECNPELSRETDSAEALSLVVA